jgi:hypothetical protein
MPGDIPTIVLFITPVGGVVPGDIPTIVLFIDPGGDAVETPEGAGATLARAFPQAGQ